MDVQKTIAEQNLNEFNQNKEHENLVTFEKSIITGQDVINTLNQSKEYENVVAIEMSEQIEEQNSILDKSSQSEEHDHLVRSEVVDEIDSIVDKSSHFEELDLLNLPIKTNHNQSSLLEIIFDDLVNSTRNPFEERSVVLNGILIPTKIYIINKEEKELKFINTCAFDSLFEISVNMYLQSSSIRTMFTRLDTTSSINFASAILNYIKNFDLDQLYQDRATILLPLFKEVIAVVNCRVNVNNLFKALFESYNTYTIRHSNCYCGHSEQKSLFTHSISTRDIF
ncbi:uncharacterized protein LOC116416733 [Nasonia vitripennis]|uniref:Uncharacterized protein n=1 Tax=Nasonia vitripennis TaxID=7425 RepID=A0A7M7Q571_NASVI|nr:uncharacterized protein LOC116416733 [Nasonia vitripennis]